MGLQCEKRLVTLVWCGLECFFFSGLLNGWILLQAVLQHEGYYRTECFNGTLARLSSDHLPTEQSSASSINLFDTNKPFEYTVNGMRRTCVFKRVLKIITVEQYAQYQQSTRVTKQPTDEQSANSAPEISAIIDWTPANDTRCGQQTTALETRMLAVLLVRDVLMLPLGVAMDHLGTSRTRLISM